MRATVRIDDPELEQEIEKADSTSELIRNALRSHINQSGPEPDGLTDHEQEALQWCRQNIRGRMSREMVCNELSQVLSVSQTFVREQILKELDSRDLIQHHIGMHSVSVSVVRDKGREHGD